MPIPWFDWLECLMFYREARLLLTGSAPAEDPRLRTVRERALAALDYGDATGWLDRGRAHVARNEWDDAAAAYARALDLLPAEPWKYGPRGAIPACADMVQPPQVFDRLVRLRPHDARPWVIRGVSRAEAGDIRPAA